MHYVFEKDLLEINRRFYILYKYYPDKYLDDISSKLESLLNLDEFFISVYGECNGKHDKTYFSVWLERNIFDQLVTKLEEDK